MLNGDRLIQRKKEKAGPVGKTSILTKLGLCARVGTLLTKKKSILVN